MSREAHVRFCESLGLRRPGPLTKTAAQLRAAKLAAALKACHKKKGSKRSSCEKAARKKYKKK